MVVVAVAVVGKPMGNTHQPAHIPIPTWVGTDPWWVWVWVGLWVPMGIPTLFPILTHCNAIQVESVSLRVVVVEGFLAKSNCSVDSRIEGLLLEGAIGKHLIDVVHGRKDHW